MKPEDKISRYLTFGECYRSTTAKRLGIDNTPPDDLIDELSSTATNIYDKIVERFDRNQVNINSFFRSMDLNKAIGGVASSQHTKGEAMDLDSLGNKNNLAIFDFIKDELVFDQLIFEYPDEHGTPDWVHVSFVRHPKTNRGQVLVKLQKKYIPFGEFKAGMT